MRIWAIWLFFVWSNIRGVMSIFHDDFGQKVLFGFRYFFNFLALFHPPLKLSVWHLICDMKCDFVLILLPISDRHRFSISVSLSNLIDCFARLVKVEKCTVNFGYRIDFLVRLTQSVNFPPSDPWSLVDIRCECFPDFGIVLCIFSFASDYMASSIKIYWDKMLFQTLPKSPSYGDECFHPAPQMDFDYIPHNYFWSNGAWKFITVRDLSTRTSFQSGHPPQGTVRTRQHWNGLISSAEQL
jgi:hypothetical protein